MNCDLVRVNHNTVLTQHQDVHGQPFGGHPQWVVYIERERGGIFKETAGNMFHLEEKMTFATHHQESEGWEVSQQSNQPS